MQNYLKAHYQAHGGLGERGITSNEVVVDSKVILTIATKHMSSFDLKPYFILYIEVISEIRGMDIFHRCLSFP